MENKNNKIYFEEYYEEIEKMQKEDKFIDSMKLIEDIGIYYM